MGNETPQFWFRSSLFSIDPREDEETNPFRYGKQLAMWIADRFRSSGYSPEVVPEDWGWCVMLTRDPFMLWIGCGNLDTDRWKELEPNEQLSTAPSDDAVVWTCFVGTDAPVWTAFFWKRLVGRGSTAGAIERVAAELEAFLRHESGIELTREP